MLNTKNNSCLKVMASLLFSSMVILGGGNYAYADFDYSEHHYKTYNNPMLIKQPLFGMEIHMTARKDIVQKPYTMTY